MTAARPVRALWLALAGSVARRSRRVRAAATPAAVLLASTPLAGAGAYPAAAAGDASLAAAGGPAPGWSIDSDAEPTHFDPGESRDATQVFSVRATGGSYQLSLHGGQGSAELSAPIAWDETAAGLREKLEAVPDVGAGGVEVSGGPGDESGSHPYTVAYVGGLSGSDERLLARDVQLTGGQASVVQEPGGVEAQAFDRYVVTATNVGARASQGEVTVTDAIPARLAATAATIEERSSKTSTKGGACALGEPVVRCEYDEPVPPGARLIVTVHVALRSGSGAAGSGPAPGQSAAIVNEATVAGGGAASAASTAEQGEIGAGPASFGIDQFAFEAVGEDGGADTLAGDRPYAVMTTLSLNTVFTGAGDGAEPYGVPEEVKDLAVQLPLGFVGDPLAAPRCPEVDMTDQVGGAETGVTACPTDTVLGSVWLVAGKAGNWSLGPFPVYNIVPERGYPAELGFNAAGFTQPFFMYATVLPSAGGYRVRFTVPGAIRVLHLPVERVALTIFGDPAAHDGSPGKAALLTNPTACEDEPLAARAEVSAWEGGNDAREALAYPQVEGCDLLQGVAGFGAQLEVQPRETLADTPTGYRIDLRTPRAPDVFGQAATPQLRDATVRLPPGVSLSPGLASGALVGCGAEQIDLLGTELGEGHPGGNGSPYDDGLAHPAPGHCPEASRIGDATLSTPLLEEPLKGHVYLASPGCGDAGQPACEERSAEDGELYGVYLELAGSGVILKLHGEVDADPASGRLTVRFLNAPQLPFEDLELDLYGGPQAALANPQTCGPAQSSGDFAPWSAPQSGPDATASSQFHPTGCATPMPFAPGFTAGVQDTQAGAYTTLVATVARQDGQQDLAGFTLRLPPGFEGALSGVEVCREPWAQLGACGAASRIGTVHVAAGAGGDPLWLEGGVYLTGTYAGAPFGLSIALDVQAGPFHLGTVVTRARVEIDPRTARVTIVGDPLPQLRDGVPLRLKQVTVSIDRPRFLFNPTGCGAEQIEATLGGDLPDGSAGASVLVSAPFAATGCRALGFDPSFAVSTRGDASRSHGASLRVTVDTPAGSANVHEVHVTMPRQLPARLQTLKLACLDRVFDVNPAACPPASAVGNAIATTPILAHRLAGPAYLVSHGGAEFPDLEIVLQGEGVELVLDGKTFVRGGVTTSTFATLPDAPVRTFALTFPEGPHSVLGAPGGDLCAAAMAMPTTMRGANGALLLRRVPVAVSGCHPQIRVLGHGAKGATATIRLALPGPGTVSATARGLTPVTARVDRAGAATLQLTLTPAERRFLARRPGRRLRAEVMLRFTARRGRRLRREVDVLVG